MIPQPTHLDPEIVRQVLGKTIHFIHGDMACAYGALLAGCNFFAGYPITPATEIAEGMAEMLPKMGGRYIQMEDEIASMGAIIGASWTGAKTMTATSGPGFSLMQENIGYAIMSETPCVVVNVQRSGPSTGQPTLAAQGDMMQARWGTHGDHQIIMLYPNSVQETLDMTITAFNLAETYRTPVLLFIDAEIGHMQEKVVIPPTEKVEQQHRSMVTHSKADYVPFKASNNANNPLIPEFAPFGHGYKTYVTGLTHNEAGLPKTNSADIHINLITRLEEKILAHKDLFTYVEEFYPEDSDVVIIAYGITSRACVNAVEQARERGIKAGMLRLITMWPFPEEIVAKWAAQARVIIVPEMNLGQMVHPIKEAVAGKCTVRSLNKIGGEIHTPGEIMQAIEEAIA